MEKEKKEKLEKVAKNAGTAMDLAKEKVGKPAASMIKGYEMPLVIAVAFMILVGLSTKMLVIGGIVLAVTTSYKWLPIVLAKIPETEKKPKVEAPVVEVKKEEVAEVTKKEE